MDDEINYQALRKIQQMEKNTPVLTKIKSDFYELVSKYLNNLKNRLQSETSSQKKTLLESEINNIEKLASNIYEQREKKIVLASISKARGGKPDMSNMLDIEKDLFNSVLSIMNKKREQFLMKKEETTDNNTSKQIKEETKERKEQKPTDKENEWENNKKSNEKQIVRITKQIPEFMGTDEKKYSIRKNDVLSMPKDMSELLNKRGIAEIINQ